MEEVSPTNLQNYKVCDTHRTVQSRYLFHRTLKEPLAPALQYSYYVAEKLVLLYGIFRKMRGEGSCTNAIAKDYLKNY